MSTKTENRPSYITDAKFIDAEDDVEDNIWPRDPTYYIRTKAWKQRIDTLLGVISQDQIHNTIRSGEVYSSLSNSVTFVKEFNGVVLYVIVSAELNCFGGEYPTNPSVNDYTYNAVSIWPYVWDRDKAMNQGKWSEQDLESIQELCEDESGQSEISKY